MKIPNLRRYVRRILRKAKAVDRIVGIAMRWLYLLRCLIRFFE